VRPPLPRHRPRLPNIEELHDHPPAERLHELARVAQLPDAVLVRQPVLVDSPKFAAYGVQLWGGRAPYGYVVVDGGPPHPNPRKAAEGFRLRVLALDEAQAAVVHRIFAEYLDGRGDRAIAAGLNQDGIPCPSASPAGAEPAPIGRRLAGQHGAFDLGEPAVHRVRDLWAVAEG
jgi:hypothetical protein